MIASGCIELEEIPLKEEGQADAEYLKQMKESVQRNHEQLKTSEEFFVILSLAIPIKRFLLRSSFKP